MRKKHLPGWIQRKWFVDGAMASFNKQKSHLGDPVDLQKILMCTTEFVSPKRCI